MTINLPAIAPQLPAWPDGVPAPTVTLDFPLKTVETYVEIGLQKVQFWRWMAQDRVSNNFDDGLHFTPSDRPWLFLGPYDRKAALAWGTAVQTRAEYALAALGTHVRAGSPAAALVLAYATGERDTLEEVPSDAAVSRADMAVARAGAALELWPVNEDGARGRVHDALTDLRHYCMANGVDLDESLRDSADTFATESADPFFTVRT